jgi:hypothetical protein
VTAALGGRDATDQEEPVRDGTTRHPTWVLLAVVLLVVAAVAVAWWLTRS